MSLCVGPLLAVVAMAGVAGSKLKSWGRDGVYAKRAAAGEAGLALCSSKAYSTLDACTGLRTMYNVE